MRYSNVYFITGTAYAGKSTLVKNLAALHGGIACGENYHDALLDGLDSREYPCLTYTRDLKNWRAFIRRSPEEYAAWIDGCNLECTVLEQEADPSMAMDNFRACLQRINSPEQYRRFLHAGFPVILRDETRSPAQTVCLAEQLWGLAPSAAADAAGT